MTITVELTGSPNQSTHDIKINSENIAEFHVIEVSPVFIVSGINICIYTVRHNMYMCIHVYAGICLIPVGSEISNIKCTIVSFPSPIPEHLLSLLL